MAKPKGSPKIGGRQKGTPNKTTSDLKISVNLLVTNNIDKAQEWLDKVGSTNPGKALELLIRLTELVLPKPIAESPASGSEKDDFYKKEAERYFKLKKTG